MPTRAPGAFGRRDSRHAPERPGFGQGGRTGRPPKRGRATIVPGSTIANRPLLLLTIVPADGMLLEIEFEALAPLTPLRVLSPFQPRRSGGRFISLLKRASVHPRREIVLNRLQGTRRPQL